MTGPIPLIVTSEAVKRISMTPGKGRTPSVAVVYATRDGDLEVLDGGKPMRWSDGMLTKYRMRYEVDISDHHLTVELKDNTALPTQADIYHFHAVISASFRVTDPAEVVRRNVTDAVPLVHGHLLGVCRPIARQYSIEEAQEAEAMIHSMFRRDVSIQGGISLYAVEARLSLDEAGRKYLQDIEAAARDDQIKAAQHTTNVHDVARESQIEELKQRSRQFIEERERLVLESQSLDPLDAVRLHLSRHPGDTEGALDRIAAIEKARLDHQAQETNRWQDFLQNMAAQGMLQPTDVLPLLQAAVRRMEDSAGASRVSASTAPPVSPASTPPTARAALDWDAPLAAPPPGPAAGGATTEPASGATRGPTAGPTEPQNICPVYVVIDESTTAEPLMDDLNTAVEDLYAALAKHEHAASAVRLAVLGFAEDVIIRTPLDKPTAGTVFPQLTARGPAEYAHLFRSLAEFIPTDLQMLRAAHASVRPPLLVLFSASAPADDAWRDAHRQLTRQQRRSDLVVFGVGAGSPTAGDLASAPELGFAAGGLEQDDAVEHFAGFLTRHVIECGTAAAAGTEMPVPAPTGFRAAEEPGDG